MLLPNHIHPSWKNFLTDEIKYELKEIKNKIGNNYNPTSKNIILRFLTIDLSRVKVIWLGQDVYPAKGVATGRSFEVGTLHDWHATFRQVSLKNIIRLIHKNYNHLEAYSDIRTYNTIKGEIQDKNFALISPNKWFDSLEKQGVLFLNTSFTCEVGKPNSHKEIWEDFSKKVLTYISDENKEIIWFLWGNEAISNKKNITDGVFYESRHPMMCSNKYENDFLKSNCFKETMHIINWLGQES